MDPLVKAVYVLRCFYGLSLRTGDDLRAELKKLVPPTGTIAVLIGLLIALTGPIPAQGKVRTTAPKPKLVETSISPGELDRSIADVMTRREYAWRMPREGLPQEDQQGRGPFASLIDWISRNLENGLKATGRWIEGVLDRLLGSMPEGQQSKEVSDRSWMASIRSLLIVLLAVLAFILVYAVWRAWRRKKKQDILIAPEPVATTPDLTDDQLTADEVPVNRWLALAREMLDKGELRMALRALYLASLAYLAERELITIAKYKSNREYERELRRRAHDQPELVNVFSTHVAIFEETWYGMHAVTREVLQRFEANHRTIMGENAE
jgi:hypothetical protein